MIHPPKDIFSDAYMTAPQKPRVKAICAFTALGEEGLRAAMMGRDGAVVQVAAPTKTNHKPKQTGVSSRQVGNERDEKIIAFLWEYGPSDCGVIAEHIGMCRQRSAVKLAKLFAAHRVKRARIPHLSRGWLYRAAQTHQAASTGENLGVL